MRCWRKNGTGACTNTAATPIALAPTAAFRPLGPFAHHTVDRARLFVASSVVGQGEACTSVLGGFYNLAGAGLLAGTARGGASTETGPGTDHTVDRAEMLVAVPLLVEDGAHEAAVLGVGHDLPGAGVSAGAARLGAGTP